MQLCEDAGFESDRSSSKQIASPPMPQRPGQQPRSGCSLSALRWALLAVEWADAELHLVGGDAGGDRQDD